MSKNDFTARIRSLTPKPRSVLKLMLAGKSDDEIAIELDTSMSTIRKHVQNLCDHFGLTREYRGLKRNRREDLIALMREYQLDLEDEGAIALPPPSKPVVVSDRVVATDLGTDWGEAIDVSVFYGRETELAQLRQWIIDDGCRLIGLLGMGGIGKTSLSVKVAEQLQDQFQLVIWRSLRYAPDLDELLTDLLQVFARYQEPSEAEPLGGKISLLMDYLRQFRCLLVLDEVEAVLQPNRIGHYLEPHKKYGELLRRIADERHQSCCLITSREKPKELVSREGESLQVRSLTLERLDEKAAQQILIGKGLYSDSQCQQLIHLYRANPLMLKLVSAMIQDLFNNNISEFLAEDTLVFDGIRSLLKKQFNRLSDLEKQVIYWIAINREPVPLVTLREDMALPASNRRLLEAVQALERRSLIGKTVEPYPDEVGQTANTLFELQPVVLEYVTERLVEKLGEEIARGELDLLNSHAILKAQSPDYIREQQIQFIVKPLIHELLIELSDAGCLVSDKRIAEQLQSICSMLREKYPLESGYAAGNIINLLNQIKIDQNTVDLSHWNFSNLVIWQAYLQGTLLHNTQFQKSHIERSVFTELLSDVLSVAFSPDGSLLAMGDAEGKVHLWHTHNYQKLNDWQAHSSWVRSIAFSPDSRTLATGGDDCKIIVWDVETGQCQKQLSELKDWVRSLTFSPDGVYLVSGGDDLVVRLWRIETSELVREWMAHEKRVRSVAFSPNGRWIASGSDDEKICLWDIEQKSCQHTLTGHADWVRSIAFSPDGALLVSSSNDGTIRLWDVAKATSLKILGKHDGWVRSVAFSPNGEFVASGSDDRLVKIWNVNTGELLQTLEEHSSRVWSVAFSPDSSKLASSSDDQRVKVWSVQKGHCLKLFQGYASGIRSVAFRFNGESLILASGGDDNCIHLWNPTTGDSLKTIAGHTGRIWTIAFSPQEDVIVSGSDDHTVRLWNLQTGKLLRVLEHSHWVRSLAFSPNGQILATAGDDGMIRLWEIHKPGCPVLELKGHEHWVRSLAFSPDGRTLISGGDDQTVKQWDVQTRKFVKVLHHGHRVRAVAFSPDGSLLASGSDDKIVNLLNLKTGQSQSFDEHTLGVKTVVFSPDGRWLATGSDDCTIKVWDVKTGKCLQTLFEESFRVRSLAFSPDGRFLASGGQGDTIRVWQLELNQSQSPGVKEIRLERPYEGMDITEVTGLSLCQKETLLALGAIEQPPG